MNELPLSKRVNAPARVRMPSTDGLVWRPATALDVEQVWQLARRMDPFDNPSYTTPRDEIADEFGHSWVTLDTDSLVAERPDGTLAAWGVSVNPPERDTLVRAIEFGGVDPVERGRGLGRQLLAWQADRGMQQLAASDSTLPGWIMAWAEEQDDTTQRLVKRAGFDVARYFLQLTRVLPEPIMERLLPPTLRIVPFERTMADEVRLARNDAFRDHWGSQPSNTEHWMSFIGSESMRPDLSFIAYSEKDEVAGFVMTNVDENDWEMVGFSSGYISLVGVPRAWRKQGIAPALLTHAMRAFAAEGLERAVLDVDSDSPTGAVSLYTGVGFTEYSRSMAYTLEF